MMIYFESILEAYSNITNVLAHLSVYDQLPTDLWYNKVIIGKPISTKQAKVCLDKFKTMIPALADELKISITELEHYILNPVYKVKPYTSFDIKPEIRHLTGNFIGIRLKYNKTIYEELKKIFTKSPFHEYRFEDNFFIVEIDSALLEPIMEIVGELGLAWDENFEMFLLHATERQNQPITITIDDNINITLPFVKSIEDAWNYILLSS